MSKKVVKKLSSVDSPILEEIEVLKLQLMNEKLQRSQTEARLIGQQIEKNQNELNSFIKYLGEKYDFDFSSAKEVTPDGVIIQK